MAKKAKPASPKQKTVTGRAKVGGKSGAKPAAKSAAKPAARTPAVKTAATSPTRAVKTASVKAPANKPSSSAKLGGSKDRPSEKDSSAKMPATAKAVSKAPIKAAPKKEAKAVSKTAPKAVGGGKAVPASSGGKSAKDKAAKPVSSVAKTGTMEKAAKAAVEAPLRAQADTKRPEAKRAEAVVPTLMSKGAAADAALASPVETAKVEKKSKKSKGLSIALDRGADLSAQWKSLYERSKDLGAVPYKMSGTYEPRTALMHKVLGWGFVLSNQNDRLEVLFQDGIKMLISNYKG